MTRLRFDPSGPSELDALRLVVGPVFGPRRGQEGLFGGGPALVQFPADARFALGQVGEVLVFAAWSPAATSDEPAAEAAFAVIKGFGQSIPIGP